MSNTVKPETIVIKIGTDALSKGGKPEVPLLKKLVAEIATLKKDGHHVVVVSSGAVGAGRAFIKGAYEITARSEIIEKQLLASIGQPRLMNTYTRLFSTHGLHATQVLLTHDNCRGKGLEELTHYFDGVRRNPIFVPIVNENDTVSTEELEELKVFRDNDELAVLVAKLVGANRVILLTNVEGVFNHHPSRPGAQLIPVLHLSCPAPLTIDTSGKSDNGRGSMESKLNAARQLHRAGINAHIASSRTPDIITRIMKNEDVGTYIPRVLPDKWVPATRTGKTFEAAL